MERKFTCVLRGVAYVLVFLLGASSYRFLTSRGVSATQRLSSVFNLIGRNYVDDINIDSLSEQTIPLILTQLDPHSSYLSAQDSKREQESLEGSFEGIGVQFNRLKDTVIVTKVIAGGGSERAGLIPGDRILRGNSISLVGKNVSNDSILSTLKGASGSVVSLDILRDSQPMVIKVVRGPVPVSTVEASCLIGDKLYIRLSRWGAMTHQELLSEYVRYATKEVNASNANSSAQASIKGIILDLRDNGGGYLESVVSLAGEFLPKNKLIVYTEGKHYKREDYETRYDGSLQDMPLAVLVNEFSASASEIFAGAMQDHDRAVIIGRRTFGKGLVQRPFELTNQGTIRLTVARYYTPSGRSIQKKYRMGIEGAEAYAQDIEERFEHGELYNADSVLIADKKVYHTDGGRVVHGGGGIIPDIFIGRDSLGINPYYIRLQRTNAMALYAFDYVDGHRKELSKMLDANALVSFIKTNERSLLLDFAYYAQRKLGVEVRSTYLEQSRKRIIEAVSFYIADLMGRDGFAYEVQSKTSPEVAEALRYLSEHPTAKVALATLDTKKKSQ